MEHLRREMCFTNNKKLITKQTPLAKTLFSIMLFLGSRFLKSNTNLAKASRSFGTGVSPTLLEDQEFNPPIYNFVPVNKSLLLNFKTEPVDTIAVWYGDHSGIIYTVSTLISSFYYEGKDTITIGTEKLNTLVEANYSGITYWLFSTETDHYIIDTQTAFIVSGVLYGAVVLIAVLIFVLYKFIINPDIYVHTPQPASSPSIAAEVEETPEEIEARIVRMQNENPSPPPKPFIVTDDKKPDAKEASSSSSSSSSSSHSKQPNPYADAAL